MNFKVNRNILFVLSMMLAVSFLAAGCDQMDKMKGKSKDTTAPRILETFPLNGATGVDPATEEIWVKFNEEMADMSWSWTTGPDQTTFPRMKSQPYYTEDNTRNNLPVILEPDKVYEIWINNEKFKNFKDKSGNPTVPFKFYFTTKSVKNIEEDNIRETVLRYQLSPYVSVQQKNARVFFLSLSEPVDRRDKEIDPSDEFVQRFDGLILQVKKVSQATVSSNGVKDKETGSQGIIFRAGAIKWISNTEVEVQGGYYEYGRSGSGNTFHLKKDTGKWVVVKDVLRWIS